MIQVDSEKFEINEELNSEDALLNQQNELIQKLMYNNKVMAEEKSKLSSQFEEQMLLKDNAQKKLEAVNIAFLTLIFV